MNVLIAGTGYVGSVLASALKARGDKVIGLTKSAGRLERLEGKQPSLDLRLADLSCLESLKSALGPKEWAELDWVIHCAASGRGGGAETYQQVYADGARNLLVCLSARTRMLFTSSTSVYAQTDGSWVDEDSATDPDRATGQILLDAERQVLAAAGVVARLAGIYGPGRSYLLQRYLTGEAVIEGDGERYLNQIHLDDIVSALLHLLAIDAKGIYNVVDSQPQAQGDVYRWLASYFEGAVPASVPPNLDRKRGWTHKRISNRRLLESGWTPCYPSFQQAVENDPTLVSSIRALR